MKIQAINNTNFQSRNKTIRFADDIARRVNVCYPRISSSIIDGFTNIYCFRKFKRKFGERIRNHLRLEISNSFDDSKTFMGKILAFVKPIKNYRLGNCGESAQLASIVARVNGLKNCYIANLKKESGEDLDHSVLYVNDKKPYVIDSWLGFADYVPNVISKYRSEFNRYFCIEDGENMKFEKLNTEYADFLNRDFSRAQINKIKKIFPEQVIKRRYV